MPKRNIIVVGASAGGVEALKELIHGMPSQFSGALFIVLHIPAGAPSVLPAILNHAGCLPVSHPVNNALIEDGHIYVAPPDYHLLIEKEHMHLVRGPTQNRHRPAIDPLFCSAAEAYGQRVIGVVLTGMLNDGTAGLLAIKRRGGMAIVQEPTEALYPYMPRSALEHVKVDYRLRVAEIGPLLDRLAQDQVPEPVRVASTTVAEMSHAIEITKPPEKMSEKPSSFSCPECGGVLWEVQDEAFLHFRCRVGHALTAEAVLLGQKEQADNALWIALRLLEEHGILSRSIAEQERTDGQDRSAQSLEAAAQHAEQDARLLRQFLSKPRLGEKLAPSRDHRCGHRREKNVIERI